MKLVIIPPYENPASKGAFVVRELVANMEKKGQLKGVEVDVDDGYPTDHVAENRDEEFLASISMGVIKKVKEYSALGKHDAIVTGGSIEPGIFAARLVSRIPVASVVHSAVHMASLIGERTTILEATDPQALIVRHLVQNYGFSQKVASVRSAAHSSTYMMRFIRQYEKEKRIKVPEVRKIIADMTAQCVAAIEEDRADSLIFGCPPLQIFAEEVRQGLDEAGYGEIPIICEHYAAVEAAKAMVNLGLIQAPRAYPGDALKAKPKFR